MVELSLGQTKDGGNQNSLINKGEKDKERSLVGKGDNFIFLLFSEKKMSMKKMSVEIF